MKVLERVIPPANSDLELRDEIATFAFRTAQCEDAVCEGWGDDQHIVVDVVLFLYA